VAGLVRHHQEMWDGSGYPDGLKGEEIPLGARILSVCDAYSAITDDRPYQKARTHADAVTELHRCAGTQFDPRVVEAFCRVMERQQEREKAGQRPR
jgi:HD-GYP domain-containing protein (c-di-GMP phosphodiesterase class II)